MNYLIAVAESSRTILEVRDLYLFADVPPTARTVGDYKRITKLPRPAEGPSVFPWYHEGVYFATVSEDDIKDKFPNGYEVRPNALVYKLED